MRYEAHSKRGEQYVAPAAELVETATEGMLCGSNEDLLETGGEW